MHGLRGFDRPCRWWDGALRIGLSGAALWALRDPEAAQRELAHSTILKFHGRPKPKEVLRPWSHPRATILRHPLHHRLWSYLADDIRSHWC